MVYERGAVWATGIGSTSSHSTRFYKQQHNWGEAHWFLTLVLFFQSLLTSPHKICVKTLFVKRYFVFTQIFRAENNSNWREIHQNLNLEKRFLSPKLLNSGLFLHSQVREIRSFWHFVWFVCLFFAKKKHTCFKDKIGKVFEKFLKRIPIEGYNSV